MTEVRSVGLVRDDIFLEHDTGPHHVETPHRLKSIHAALDDSTIASRCASIPLREATDDELAAVHTHDYIARLAATAGRPPSHLDADTVVSPESHRVARLAAGSTLNAVDRVLDGKCDAAFACIRPPGHHAESDHAMGFCLFNNIAVAARYAQQRHGCTRVLIVDFDVHHGNGTQHAFYEDPTVLYFSTHQAPFYPGTGGVAECGRGPGEGFTVNVPFRSGAGDDEYGQVYETVLAPVADEWRPDCVLVSAGFDAYIDDPLAGMRVTEQGYAALARCLLGIADRYARGKSVWVLEGGYNLAGLGRCTAVVVEQMLTAPVSGEWTAPPPPDWMQPVREAHARYWKALG